MVVNGGWSLMRGVVNEGLYCTTRRSCIESCLWRGFVPAVEPYAFCSLFAEAIWRLYFVKRESDAQALQTMLYYNTDASHRPVLPPLLPNACTGCNQNCPPCRWRMCQTVSPHLCHEHSALASHIAICQHVFQPCILVTSFSR